MVGTGFQVLGVILWDNILKLFNAIIGEIFMV